MFTEGLSPLLMKTYKIPRASISVISADVQTMSSMPATGAAPMRHATIRFSFLGFFFDVTESVGHQLIEGHRFDFATEPARRFLWKPLLLEGYLEEDDCGWPAAIFLPTRGWPASIVETTWPYCDLISWNSCIRCSRRAPSMIHSLPDNFSSMRDQLRSSSFRTVRHTPHTRPVHVILLFFFFFLVQSITNWSVCVCVSLMACFLFSLALAGAAQPDVQRDVVHVDAGVVVVVVVVDGRPRRRRLRPALPAARRRRPARRPEFRPRRRDARRPPAGRAAGQPHRIGQGGNIIFNDLLIKKD